MSWGVIRTARFDKAIKKLDRPARERILIKLYGLEEMEEPTDTLVPYSSNLAGLWKLRVGAYRVIVDVQQERLVILAVDVGHRSTVYKQR